MEGTSLSVCFWTSVSLYFVVSGSFSFSPLRAYTSTSLPTPFKLCNPKDVPLNSFLFSNSSYTFLDTHTPPTGDKDSSLLAILTPSPNTSCPSKTISPICRPTLIFRCSSS